MSKGFWAWSGRVYGREGVKEACLAFQAAGGDVNVALWCCWLAARGVKPAGDALETAARLSAQMQASILGPLRDARDALKSPPGAVDAEEAADARDSLLASELEIEQLEQDALERLDTIADTDGPPDERALRLITGVLAAMGARGVDAAGAPAQALVDAVFTQTLYTLTRTAPALHALPGEDKPARTAVTEETLDEDALLARLADLREEHRAMDAAVSAMSATGVADQLKIARLKKRKLQLRDEIAAIEDQLNPDIIA